jgi:hypothetical protein
MKALFLVIIVFNFYGLAFAQDSARTRNDKPGTPQSLRTPDNSPRSKVTLINSNTTPNQDINHGATESNEVNNNKQQVIVPANNNGSTLVNQPPPATIINKPVNVHDTLTRNGKNNVSNPTRK